MTPVLEPPRANVLGVGIHAITMKAAIARIAAALKMGEKGYVCVTGVQGVMEAQRDAAFKAILNRSLLNTPDGMPTVWVGWMQGYRRMGRVFGPDLMLRACEWSVGEGYTHFLYGGAEGVAETLRQVLLRKFPGLKIVGTYTPPFRPLTSEEETELRARISALKPDIIWVGISTPKQERFMAEQIQKLNTKLMFGVGAAFDYHTGRIKDAPEWMKSAGLQWLNRLYQEPRRLWKRYLLRNPQFIFAITRQLLGLSKDELA